MSKCKLTLVPERAAAGAAALGDQRSATSKLRRVAGRAIIRSYQSFT